jgi:hypothetical protein
MHDAGSHPGVVLCPSMEITFNVDFTRLVGRGQPRPATHPTSFHPGRARWRSPRGRPDRSGGLVDASDELDQEVCLDSETGERRLPRVA